MSDNDSITETINFINGNRTITTANGFGSANNNSLTNNMRLTLPNLIQPKHEQNQQETHNTSIDEQMNKNNKQNQLNKIYQRKIQSSPAKQRRLSHEVSTLSGTTKKIINVS